MKISMNNRMYREYSKITEINYYAKIDFNFSIFIGYNVVLLSDKKIISEDSVNRGIRFLGGKTQYEIENNEIYINNYARNNDILEIIKAGFIIARKLESEFHKLNKNNICIIISNFAHRFSLCTLKIQYLAVIQLSKSSCYAA